MTLLRMQRMETRSIVLRFQGIILFEKRYNLSYFIHGMKYCLLYGEVDNMGDSWQDVINHKLYNLSINIINPT